MELTKGIYPILLNGAIIIGLLITIALWVDFKKSTLIKQQAIAWTIRLIVLIAVKIIFAI